MKNRLLILITLAATLIVACILILHLKTSSHPICYISKDQSDLETLDLAVTQYIEKTHRLPSWGVGFTDDLKRENLFEHPDREIYDSWGGKYYLTLTLDGTSLQIVSAGKDCMLGTGDDIGRRLNLDPNQRVDPTSANAQSVVPED